MKKTLLILLIIRCSFFAAAQNAFLDAQKIVRLQKTYDANNTNTKYNADTINAILVKYVSSINKISNVAKLKGAYQFSSYIKYLLDSSNFESLSIAGVSDRLKEKLKKNPTGFPAAVILLQRINISDTLSSSRFITSLRPVLQSVPAGGSLPDTVLVKDSALIISAWKSIYGNRPVLANKVDSLRKIAGEISSLINDKHYVADTIIKDFRADTNLSSREIKSVALPDNRTIKTVDLISKLQSEQLVVQQITQANVTGRMALPSESEIIDAMAIYLVNRVKTEASLAFFEQLKNVIRQDTILLALFPKSIAFLSQGQNYEAPNFGQQFRQAFAEDFVAVPDKLAGETDFQEYFQHRLNGPGRQYYAFFQMVVKICSMSRDNANFIDIISYVKRDLKPADNYVLSSYIQYLDMINNEFFSVRADGKYWISYAEFNQLTAEDFQVLAALLKSRYPAVFNFLLVRLDDNGEKSLPAATDLRNWMAKFFFIINQYQIAIQNTSNLKSNLPHDVSSYWTFINDTFGQFTQQENGHLLLKLDPSLSKIQDGTQRFQNYLKVARTTYREVTTLYRALQSRNYPLVLEKIKVLFENLQDKSLNHQEIFIKYFLRNGTIYTFNKWQKSDTTFYRLYTLVDKFQTDFENGITGADLQSDIFSINNQAGIIEHRKSGFGKWFKPAFSDNYKNFITEFTSNYQWYRQNYDTNKFAVFEKVMIFINDVMSAGSTQELTNVITTYASPPQSYRVKRNSRFSFDLNAYVGVVAGLEDFKNPHFSYGLTAPIGVAYSFGGTSRVTDRHMLDGDGNKVYLRGNSFSLALSIIDIGAVVRYRFAGDNSDGLPAKVTFSQFISPGLYGHWGIRNTPLDIVLGCQYLPKLRKFADPTPAVQPTSLTSVLQFNIGVVFDLPLFNFFHTPR